MAIAFFTFIRSLFVGRRVEAGTPVARATVRQPVAAAKPVRVVHKGPGRLVISGRLADVCAELDRLAALEAQGALAPAR